MRDSYHCSLSQIQGVAARGKKSKGIGWLLARLAELEEENFIPNPFEHIGELHATGLLPKSREPWRLVKCELGQIVGLPRSRGLLVAKSGTLCCIWGGGISYYIGHWENWVRELDNPITVKSESKKDKEVALAHQVFV